MADGRYDYIETGSLISITKNTKDITIPSEEERMTLQSMDYEEFRWAMGDTVSIPLLKQFFDKRMMLSQAHRTKMRELRLYMLVGGMPQAVNEYLETNNLSMVDLVKRDIIRLYLDDFQKIDPSRRIEQLYMNIPAQLNQNSNRYKPYSVVGSIESDKLQGLLREMEDSKTVLFAYHANDPNIGMALHQDTSKFKMFCADTGLFITLAFWDKSFTENVIYEKLLSDKLSTNLGYVYENLVAQMLTASGNKLFYYSWARMRHIIMRLTFSCQAAPRFALSKSSHQATSLMHHWMPSVKSSQRMWANDTCYTPRIWQKMETPYYCHSI